MLVRLQGKPDLIEKALKGVEEWRIESENNEKKIDQKEAYEERKKGKGRGTQHTCLKCKRTGPGFHTTISVEGSDGKTTREKVCKPIGDK